MLSNISVHAGPLISSEYSRTDRTKRIMIVDDEADIVAVLSSSFRNEGFAIHAHTNPQQALTDFKSGYYDALIIDIKMPVMNGFELYHMIRQLDPTVNVCFFTAFETANKTYNELISGIDSHTIFVKKPISSRALIKIVCDMLTS